MSAHSEGNEHDRPTVRRQKMVGSLSNTGQDKMVVFIDEIGRERDTNLSMDKVVAT